MALSSPKMKRNTSYHSYLLYIIYIYIYIRHTSAIDLYLCEFLRNKIPVLYIYIYFFFYIYIYNRFKYIANTLIHSLPSQRWPKLAPMAEKFLKAAQARQEKAAGQIAASDSQLTIGYGSEGETRRSATPKYRTDWG